MVLKASVIKEQALLMVENRDTQILTIRSHFQNLLDVVFLGLLSTSPLLLSQWRESHRRRNFQDGSRASFPSFENSWAPRNRGSVFSNETICLEGWVDVGWMLAVKPGESQFSIYSRESRVWESMMGPRSSLARSRDEAREPQVNQRPCFKAIRCRVMEEGT